MKLYLVLFLSVLSNSAFAGIVTQTSDDVQILQAWRDRSIELRIDDCDGALPTQNGEHGVLDCSRQAERLTQAPWASEPSPAVNSWALPVRRFEGRVYSPYYVGNIVEVRALVKRSVFESPSFTGVGFYFNNRIEDGVRFIEKAKLHVVSASDVYLATTGEPAVVLRFVLWMPGYQGNSGTGWSRDSVAFKPFAEFASEGSTFQNWDVASVDYRIYRAEYGGGRLEQIVRFDRQQQLLRQ